MKRKGIFFLLCCLFFSFYSTKNTFSEEGDLKAKWLTDYQKACSLAKKHNRPILIDFTGSDWCGWCIKLKKEVFDKKAFKKYAGKNLILLEIDFPQKKAQSSKLKKQNKALSEKYQVRGYPTIILTDYQGNKIAQTGYREGGEKKYVQHLEDLLS